MKKKVFVSFDYDNDYTQKFLLVGQSILKQSPFEFTDSSIKQEIENNWEVKARQKISNCDVVLVLCGKKTHLAKGVSREIEIAREVGKSYYLVNAYGDSSATRPSAAYSWETIYDWTWQNLNRLVG